ncbi:MAG TPA: YXWGXW repeat-containing protein [Candidatus Sulfotelmatobacter sp.]|nr:YXWGXW repeat-containing protein [Candidatus Sulfotelmatobacter sp.]
MDRNRVVRWLVFAILLLSLSAGAFGEVFVSVRFGPPALPVYVQPVCPGPGYVWTPGYWAWSDDDGYYWVPGTWVVAPVGLLWTPGYWGWDGGVYIFHAGYWGPHVGFYGGINYGFGYTGVGFVGGEWRGREFFYNRSVTNVTNITNVYNKTVIVNNTHVSYNGGEGGIHARPRPEELRAEHERHQEALPTQREHMQAAMRNPELRASVNHGRPAVAATLRPADFHSAVRAKAAGAAYHEPKMSPREARGAERPADRGMNARENSRQNDSRNNARNNRGNDGFRPFSPPSKNDRGRDEAASRSNNERGNNGRMANDRMNNNRMNNQRNNDRMANDRMNNERNNDRGNGSRPSQSAPRGNEMRQSRPAPQVREAAPRHESAPPQRHESAPRGSDKHNK